MLMRFDAHSTKQCQDVGVNKPIHIPLGFVYLFLVTCDHSILYYITVAQPDPFPNNLKRKNIIFLCFVSDV